MAVKCLGRATRPLGVALLIGSLALAGCSSTGGAGLFASYTAAPDDTCGQYRQQLGAYRDYFFSAMVQGATIGAAVGGLTGYLAGGDVKSTLFGAGAGAVTGAVGAYFIAKQKAANGNPTVLADSVYDDLNTENSEIDGVTGTFEKLRDCRLEAAREVKHDLAAHQISRDDAQAKLRKIHDWFVQDIDFADALGAKMNQRGTEYADASDKMMASEPSAKRTLETRRSAPPRHGGGEGGGGLVAGEASRVREAPTTSSRQIALLAPGDSVSPLSGGNTPEGWTHVQLGDGRSGYVASRLLHEPGAAGTAPPPKDVAGVAQLTESNQLKRKALTEDVAEAKSAANGSAFQLNGSISRIKPAPVARRAA
ncbi:MAG TPA: SH3 domain-containing protein [Stellaceae bacterium]|nr:SH3 domain-containing protein [Stellaceae bacterium]